MCILDYYSSNSNMHACLPLRSELLSSARQEDLLHDHSIALCMVWWNLCGGPSAVTCGGVAMGAGARSCSRAVPPALLRPRTAVRIRRQKRAARGRAGMLCRATRVHACIVVVAAARRVCGLVARALQEGREGSEWRRPDWTRQLRLKLRWVSPPLELAR